MELRIATLFECESSRKGGFLPHELCSPYGGDLRFAEPPSGRPLVVANFVSTLDGVVSFNIPGESGGSAISGGNEGDHFIMGLLRACADVILVGSGTVSAVSPGHLWTAEYIYPNAMELYEKCRQAVHAKAKHPLLAIVTGTGRVDLSRAVFHTSGISVLLLTTEKGRRTLVDAGVGALSSTLIRVLPAFDGRLPSVEVLHLLKEEFGAALVLHEGGPTLFGQFLADAVVDELFLTLSPQIAGRLSARSRPALVMNTGFFPGTAPWLDLLSVKRAGDHLYLRYGVRAGGKA